MYIYIYTHKCIVITIIYSIISTFSLFHHYHPIVDSNPQLRLFALMAPVQRSTTPHGVPGVGHGRSQRKRKTSTDDVTSPKPTHPLRLWGMRSAVSTCDTIDPNLWLFIMVGSYTVPNVCLCLPRCYSTKPIFMPFMVIMYTGW